MLLCHFRFFCVNKSNSISSSPTKLTSNSGFILVENGQHRNFISDQFTFFPFEWCGLERCFCRFGDFYVDDKMLTQESKRHLKHENLDNENLLDEGEDVDEEMRYLEEE